RPDTTLLWQRMTGEQDQAEARPASVAFGRGGFSAGFRHADGSRDGDTVLSPGVIEAVPGEPIAVGSTVQARFGFDAGIDQNVPATTAVYVEGCITQATEPSWQLGALLVLDVQATQPGEGAIRLR